MLQKTELFICNPVARPAKIVTILCEYVILCRHVISNTKATLNFVTNTAAISTRSTVGFVHTYVCFSSVFTFNEVQFVSTYEISTRLNIFCYIHQNFRDNFIFTYDLLLLTFNLQNLNHQFFLPLVSRVIIGYNLNLPCPSTSTISAPFPPKSRSLYRD
jgi:hypothetical protein